VVKFKQGDFIKTTIETRKNFIEH